MLLHHVVTLALLLICYAINMVKMGVLIVLVHDVGDVPLEVWVNAGSHRLSTMMVRFLPMYSWQSCSTMQSGKGYHK